MNNAQLAQFATVPQNQTLHRSLFDVSHGNKFTAKVGDLVPYESIEVLPGDSFFEKQSQLLRQITPLFPTMDNAFADFFWFFVPNRLCYLNQRFEMTNDHWQQICGENKKGFWKQAEEVEALTIQLPDVKPQSIMDYLDFPQGDWLTKGIKQEINPSSIVCVGLIYNEFFRDQNLEAPIQDWESFITKTAPVECLKVAKFKDYFTSLLPEPLKHDPVEISLGDEAPLKGEIHTEDSLVHSMINGRDTGMYREILAVQEGQTKYLLDKNEIYGDNDYATIIHKRNDDTAVHAFDSRYQPFSNNDLITFKTNAVNLDTSKLKADLSSANAITINDLRLAFATMKLYERDARSGSRYIEMLKSHWNITIKDETIQRPEYLGGKRIPLNIQQVQQTSGQTETSTPLGFTGGTGLTTGATSGFAKSFKEAGWLIAVMCIRTNNTYYQGLPLKHTRKNRLDFYNPEFANIGEQPVKNKELYLSDNTKDQDKNNEIMGYKEPWVEYRYIESRLKGYFKANDPTLEAWTYAQKLAEIPGLNNDFIKQSRSAFTKTLATNEENTPFDFIIDIWHDMKASRPLPVYSVPSLIDHN